MKNTARPSRGDAVQAGWLILIIFGLITFAVDANTAAAILFVGILTAVPLKAVGFDAPILSDLWGTSTPQRHSVDAAKQDALSLLRTRYARGELTEDEFEQKLEHLLETETID